MKRLFTVISIIVLFMLLISGLTSVPAYAQETLAVNIIDKQKVHLVEDNLAVDVRVEVTCPAGASVLEALIYVVQDGNTSQFAGLPVTCDGVTHEVVVRVFTFPETPFHKGKAFSSAYLLLDDPEGTSAGDSANLKIRK